MLNSQFNSEQFNQDHTISEDVKWLIEFDWFDLTSMCWWKKYWYMLKNGDVFDLNNINIWEFVSSMIDGGWVYNKKYGNRSVSFRLFIQWENYQDLMDKIDNLKEKTQWVEKDFDVFFLWWYRTTKATLSSVKIPSFGKNQDFVDDVELTFLFTSWYWENKSGVSEFIADVTDDFESVINNEGKYETFPKLFFNCKASGNTLTMIEIEIKQVGETEWFILSIQETITNNDLIVFDYQNKTVTINWEEVPFFWVMTPMWIWQNVVNVNFTGWANLDAYIIYNKTFL